MLKEDIKIRIHNEDMENRIQQLDENIKDIYHE